MHTKRYALFLDDPKEFPSGVVVGEGGRAWTVVSRIERGAGATGSNFSCGYIVRDESGHNYFLKAINLHAAMAQAPNRASSKIVTDVLTAFEYEKDVSTLCRQLRTTRVLCAVDSGEVYLDRGNPYSLVPFLIFELARGDLRKVADEVRWSDHEWAFSVLRDTASGVRQLHAGRIAHQDIKPSNVMCFSGRAGERAKVADLGRVVCGHIESIFSKMQFAGDFAHCSPEILFRGNAASWNERFQVDLYMLGALVAYLLAGIPFNVYLDEKLKERFGANSNILKQWGSDYRSLIPLIEPAYFDVVGIVVGLVPDRLKDTLREVMRLCHPDPVRRRVGSETLPIDTLTRCVSMFDNLAFRSRVLRSASLARPF